VRRKLSKSVLLALILVVLGATPAMADPAKPTNYESRVIRITPDVPGVKAQVVGGDGFLSLTVDKGHEVIVPSTSSNAPPYLRFRKDGTVEENLLSVNTYLNNSRYATNVVTPDSATKATADTPPQWKKVASGGSYAWHDHRIHWMGQGAPPQLQGKSTGKVSMGSGNGDWRVPLIVDGKPVTVIGDLHLRAGISPLPYLAIAAVVGALVFFLGRRWAVNVGVGAVLVGGVVALGIGLAQNHAIPPGAGAMVVTVALPAVAVVAAVTGLILRPPHIKVIAGLAAAASLLGWVATRFNVFIKAILPTDIPFAVDRIGTAVVVGLSVAAAALLVVSGALSPAAAKPAKPAEPDPSPDPAPEPA
jgi:hypothetical protein